jgi:hypothetical protein
VESHQKKKKNLIELGVNQNNSCRQILDVANSIAMEIKPITKDNFSDLVEIYGQGLATNIATFQNDLPLWEDWDKGHLDFAESVYMKITKCLVGLHYLLSPADVFIRV